MKKSTVQLVRKFDWFYFTHTAKNHNVSLRLAKLMDFTFNHFTLTLKYVIANIFV